MPDPNLSFLARIKNLVFYIHALLNVAKKIPSNGPKGKSAIPFNTLEIDAFWWY